MCNRQQVPHLTFFHYFAHFLRFLHATQKQHSMHQNMDEASFLLFEPFVKIMRVIYDQIVHGVVSEMFV